MGLRRRLWMCVVALAVVWACGLGSTTDLPGDNQPQGNPSGNGGGPGADGGLPPPVDGGVSGDVPCPVASMLETYCLACHGAPPSQGAPMSIDSRAAMLAPAPTQPSTTVAALSVARMANPTAPMPPAPYAPVPQATQDMFSAWVGGGLPPGSCTVPDAGSGPPDAGSPPPPDGGGSPPPADAGVSGDLPCDVASVLVDHCTLCHGSPPTDGAPMSINSLAAMRAPAPTQPSKSVGELSVERMASTTSPMPPAPDAPVPSAEQATVASWVNAGMPAGTCGAPGPDGGVDAGVDPVFGGPPTCTSGTYYTSGDGPLMHPGLACIACHSRGDGPRFAVAGTIYPTGHEYDDCDGTAAAGAVVSVTDSAGVTRSFSANSVGNFSGSGASGWPQLPIRAQVTFQGRVRAMSGAVSSGDCNTCHTLNGASGAPGRIALP